MMNARTFYLTKVMDYVLTKVMDYVMVNDTPFYWEGLDAHEELIIGVIELAFQAEREACAQAVEKRATEIMNDATPGLPAFWVRKILEDEARKIRTRGDDE